MNPKVDTYLNRAETWQEELKRLQTILLDCGLSEDLKWGAPCYAYRKTNIAIIGGFKECCVLSFFKGVLLEDPDQILSKPGENTQSARLIRFTDVRQIDKMEPVLKA